MRYDKNTAIIAIVIYLSIVIGGVLVMIWLAPVGF